MYGGSFLSDEVSRMRLEIELFASARNEQSYVGAVCKPAVALSQEAGRTPELPLRTFLEPL